MPSRSKPRGPNPETYARDESEHSQQVALFMWAAKEALTNPLLKSLFAIPNGGLRDKVTAANLKAEGVRSGVPDTLLAVPAGQWHGLFIEMKRPDGRLSEDQIEWKQRLLDSGYGVFVAYRWTEARDAILAYLKYRTDQ